MGKYFSSNAGRRHFCQACSFARSGVKTRKAIPHTCAEDGFRISRFTISKVKHQYIPTREELDKYLARLKELMEEEVPCSMNDVTKVEFKLVDSANAYPDDLKAGEAIVFEYPDKTLGPDPMLPIMRKSRRIGNRQS